MSQSNFNDNGRQVTIAGNMEDAKKDVEKSVQKIKEEKYAELPRALEAGEAPEEIRYLVVGRHFKWSGDCTVAANKNLPIKAVTHTACGKKRHAFFLHRTGKAVSWYL